MKQMVLVITVSGDTCHDAHIDPSWTIDILYDHMMDTKLISRNYGLIVVESSTHIISLWRSSDKTKYWGAPPDETRKTIRDVLRSDNMDDWTFHVVLQFRTTISEKDMFYYDPEETIEQVCALSLHEALQNGVDVPDLDSSSDDSDSDSSG